MIAHQFEYCAPETLEEAMTLLGDPEAKPLAGGMSLIPMMKMRLAAPAKLVDLRRIAVLRSIRQQDGLLRIGAMVTHHELASTPLIRMACPLLAKTAAAIGDVQIRNAGTLGGSVARADPAADYPAALHALDAKVVLTGPRGERELSFGEFHLDTFTTALEPGELVTAIIVGAEANGTGVHYQKQPQPASGFPIVGVAARIGVANGVVTFARIGVTGLSGKGFRAVNVEARLSGKPATGDSIRTAAALTGEGQTASADIHCSAAYRVHLACVAAERAVKAAIANAG